MSYARPTRPLSAPVYSQCDHAMLRRNLIPWRRRPKLIMVYTVAKPNVLGEGGWLRFAGRGYAWVWPKGHRLRRQ
jgi:hypothetical protein